MFIEKSKSTPGSITPRNQGGFTLIEILIVVVILGVLGAVVVPQLLDRPDQARVAAAKSDIRQLSSALDLYRLDNFNYPTTDQGLQALVTRPSGTPEAPNWNPDGYVRHNLQDPWGTPYVYANEGTNFEVISYGQDRAQGAEGLAADISSNDLN